MILKLLKKITTNLEKHNIHYMLSGSIALNNYTIPRMTLDIDIVIEINDVQIEQFISLFDQNYYINPSTVREEVKRKGMFNVIDHETGFKIDFIVRKETSYRILEFSRRKKIDIGDLSLWIVSPEDLVVSKVEWIQQLQSEKQMSDIRNLMQLPTIDKVYIKDWCQKLNLNTFDLI